MGELWTKLSDYFNEKRNCPEKREDRLAIVLISVSAVVVVVLLLLVLWGHLMGERGQKAENVEETAAIQTLEMDAPEKDAQALPSYEDHAAEVSAENEENKEISTLQEEAAVVSKEYEQEAAKYLALGDKQEKLRQEYLQGMDQLDARIAELLENMTQMESRLEENRTQYQTSDSGRGDQISSLYTEVNVIVQNLKQTQTEIYDLTDLVRVMNSETIPLIQEQIAGMQENMDRIHTAVEDLSAKADLLEQADDRLREELADAKNILKDLADNTLRYRYDAETKTLYLESAEE